MQLHQEYDVAIIGGGVNGTGIARDCAMRGLKTILIEKKDLASGASGANSGMIHGGIRYLQHDANTTRLSCIDSGYIQKIAPHLLFRVPFMFPIPGGVGAGRVKQRLLLPAVEAYFAAYDKYSALKNGMPHTRLSAGEAYTLEPRLARGMIGAVTTDEWGTDPFRLCVANAISAREHGADILVHTEVRGLMTGEHGRCEGLKVRDALTGECREIRARVTFCAVGPWTPRMMRRFGDVEVKLRPGKGIHLVYDRRVVNHAVIAYAVDGRQVFIMPHENGAILGTTDDDYYGDPDEVKGTRDEVEYLLQAVEQVIPSIRQHRVTRVMAGVRPTLHEYGKNEDALSRSHRILDHAGDGRPGLLSVAGGKLASYRELSQEAADEICRQLGVERACRTHLEKLPGGDDAPPPSELGREFHLPANVVERVIYRHGSRARDVLALTREDKRNRALVCECEPVTEGELRYSIRHEFVRRLTDVRKRTRCAMGSCQGCNCIARAGQIFAEERGLRPEESRIEIIGLLQERWKGKSVALGGPQLAVEEINQAIHFGLGGMNPGERARAAGSGEPRT
ncbi:MAG: Anaerobic glycerol-3-phosphate dehydrogenase subunit A [Myxococcota bacterium]|nr:Anaerobic glycerol-3-phosphate dehydrogenase subunit A [Myxococcota bacterium]